MEKGIKVLSLFDGMSCGQIAFKELGINVDKYNAYEIDKYAIAVTQHNFPNTIQGGDVFNADFTQFEGVDWLIGGSPCTYWSIAQTRNREHQASGLGWELFSQYVRALHEAKPKYFLYENNASMSEDIRLSIAEAFGFDQIEINSALVSAQSRRRYYWVGIRQNDGTYRKAAIEQPRDRGVLVKDILEAAGAKDRSYSLTTPKDWVGREPDSDSDLFTLGYAINRNETESDTPIRVATVKSGIKSLLADSQANRVYSYLGKAVTVRAKEDSGFYACPTEYTAIPNVCHVDNGQTVIDGFSYPINLPDGFYSIRKLTIGESKKLQTVPSWYDFSAISKAQTFRCLGNGWTVDVIMHLMRSAMENGEIQTEPSLFDLEGA